LAVNASDCLVLHETWHVWTQVGRVNYSAVLTSH